MDNFDGIAFVIQMHNAHPVACTQDDVPRHVMGQPPCDSHMLCGQGHHEGEAKGDETRHTNQVAMQSGGEKRRNVAVTFSRRPLL